MRLIQFIKIKNSCPKRMLIAVLLVQSVLYGQKHIDVSPFISVSGLVKDAQSAVAIANVDLYLLNCNKSVVADAEGRFLFTIPKSSFNDKMIISAVGYYSDTIMVSELEKLKSELLQIKLSREDLSVSLNETVIVSSKKRVKTLDAKTILKRAEENIENNYYQNPFNQKFFFRAQTSKDKVSIIDEEGVIDTFSPNGIKVSDDPTKHYYGEIVQFRNKVNSLSNENWKGIGYFGVIIFRNIMLSKRNVLYETKDFDVKKEGTTIYGNKKVYVISFENLKPTVFSTGFGNPEPKSVNGFIYIETDTFAVVKFEQYVVLRAERPNDNDDVKIESSLKITQTYKNVKGKYFINYCSEKVESNWYSLSDKKYLSSATSNYDLMSEDISTDKVVEVKRPIDRLKLDASVSDVVDKG